MSSLFRYVFKAFLVPSVVQRTVRKRLVGGRDQAFMQRRDFIKEVGAYALALRGLTTAQRSSEFQRQGQRQVLDLSGSWEFRMDRTNRGVNH